MLIETRWCFVHLSMWTLWFPLRSLAAFSFENVLVFKPLLYGSLWLFFSFLKLIPLPPVIALGRRKRGEGMLVFNYSFPPSGHQSFSPVWTCSFLTHSWSSWWSCGFFVDADCLSMSRVSHWCCLHWVYWKSVAWQRKPRLWYCLFMAVWCRPLLDVLA